MIISKLSFLGPCVRFWNIVYFSIVCLVLYILCTLMPVLKSYDKISPGVLSHDLEKHVYLFCPFLTWEYKHSLIDFMHLSIHLPKWWWSWDYSSEYISKIYSSMSEINVTDVIMIKCIGRDHLLFSCEVLLLSQTAHVIW